MATLNYSTINLLDAPNYSCTANVLGETLKIGVTWVERIQKRFITVVGSNNTNYLQNTAINVNEALEFGFNSYNREGVKYSLLLLPKDSANPRFDYLNWSKNFKLLVYYEQPE